MRLYADDAALAAYPGGSSVPDGDAAALLRTASRVVDFLLTGRAYATDTAGLPTDPDVAQAMSDATCAIVVECAATGALQAGATQQYATVGIGNVSLSGATTREGTTSVSGVPVPAAAMIALADVGTNGVSVGSRGASRPLDWLDRT